MAELRFGEQLEHRSGHDVRGGVAHDAQRVWIFLGEQMQLDVFMEWGGQIDEALGLGIFRGVHGFFSAGGGNRYGGVERLDARDDGRSGEAWGDAFGYLQRRCSGGKLFDSTVGEFD